MKRKEFIELLQEQYPAEAAWAEDFIGLQVEGREEIERVMVTLDLTLDVINQAISSAVDAVVTHHPFIFGDKMEVLANNKMLNAKHELLTKMGINVIAVHTNADFNPESIAFAQAIAIEAENIEQLNNNLAVSATIEPKYLADLSEFIKNAMDLDYDFRTNADENMSFSRLVIASGAAGDIIFSEDLEGKLFITGEMKHHHWVYANENDISVLEIGHFSEKVFKEMVAVYLEENNLKVIRSEEKNGYKTI